MYYYGGDQKDTTHIQKNRRDMRDPAAGAACACLLLSHRHLHQIFSKNEQKKS